MYLILLKKKHLCKRGQVASAPPPTLAACGPSEGRGQIQVDSHHQREVHGFQEAGIQGKELPGMGGFLQLPSGRAWQPSSCLLCKVSFTFVSWHLGRPPSILPSPSHPGRSPSPGSGVANELKAADVASGQGFSVPISPRSPGSQISVRKHLSVTKISQPQKQYPFQKPKHFFL